MRNRGADHVRGRSGDHVAITYDRDGGSGTTTLTLADDERSGG